jgi:ketosteroid isomerase-like protein
MTPQDLKVKVYGDTAIVSGQTTDKGKYKGQDISGTYRFTDVFVKRDGKWMAVSTHVTPVVNQ